MTLTRKEFKTTTKQALVRYTVRTSLYRTLNEGYIPHTLNDGNLHFEVPEYARALVAVKQGDGTTLTQVSGTPSSNGEYSYDEATGALELKVSVMATTPPKANSSISQYFYVEWYAFFTDGVETAFPEDPTSDFSDSNRTRSWRNAITAPVTVLTSIRNNLFGVVEYEASPISMDLDASGLRPVLEDRYSSIIGTDVEVFYRLDDDVVRMATVTGFSTGPEVLANTLTIPMASRLADLARPAEGKHTTRYYNDLGIPQPGKETAAIPLVFGNFSTFADKPVPLDGWDHTEGDVVFDIDNIQKAVCAPYNPEVNTANNTRWTLCRTLDSLRVPSYTDSFAATLTMPAAAATVNLTAAMVGTGNDTWNNVPHGFFQNDAVYFTGSVPAGITANLPYYIEKIDNLTFAVRSAVGEDTARVNLTSTGGTHAVHKLDYFGGDPSLGYDSVRRSGYARYHRAELAFSNANTNNFQVGDIIGLVGKGSYGGRIDAMIVSIEVAAATTLGLLCRENDVPDLAIPGTYSGGSAGSDFTINLMDKSINLVMRDMSTGDVRMFFPERMLNNGASSIIETTSNGETLVEIDLDGQTSPPLWDSPQLFNTSFPDPLRHEWGFFIRTDGSNATHAKVINHLLESAGLTVNAASITQADTDLAADVVMSVPAPYDNTLLAYKEYLERVLRSTGGYVYMNASGEAVYELFDLPAAGTSITDGDIETGTFRTAYDYSEINTVTRIVNPEVTETDATPETSERRYYDLLLGDKQQGRLEVVAEDPGVVENAQLQYILDERTVRYSFFCPGGKLLEHQIGQDLTINSVYTNSQDVNATIVHLEKSTRGVFVEVITLEGFND